MNERNGKRHTVCAELSWPKRAGLLCEVADC